MLTKPIFVENGLGSVGSSLGGFFGTWERVLVKFLGGFNGLL